VQRPGAAQPVILRVDRDIRNVILDERREKDPAARAQDTLEIPKVDPHIFFRGVGEHREEIDDVNALRRRCQPHATVDRPARLVVALVVDILVDKRKRRVVALDVAPAPFNRTSVNVDAGVGQLAEDSKDADRQTPLPAAHVQKPAALVHAEMVDQTPGFTLRGGQVERIILELLPAPAQARGGDDTAADIDVILIAPGQRLADGPVHAAPRDNHSYYFPDAWEGSQALDGGG